MVKWDHQLKPATAGSYGGQRLILATPNPNQSRLPIGRMGVNMNPDIEGKEDPVLLHIAGVRYEEVSYQALVSRGECRLGM
jgi:hypothetical protein